MADTITAIIVQIQAQTAQAADDLKNFVTQSNGDLKTLETTINETFANAAKQTEKSIGGMSYYFRSGIDGIRAAAAGGGDRAIFYAVDEGIRGLLASGLGLGTLVPILGAVSAAAGAGWLVWNEYKSNLQDISGDVAKLNGQFKTLATSIGLISGAGKTGLVGKGGMDYLMGLATGNVHENISLPISQAKGRLPDDQYNKILGDYHQKVLDDPGARDQDEPTVTVPMTQAELEKQVMDYLERSGFVDKKKGKDGEPDSFDPTVIGQALIRTQQLQQNAGSPLTGTVAELQKKQQEFLDEFQKMQALATAKIGDAPTAAQSLLNRNLTALKAQWDKQFDPAIAAAQEKVRQEAITKAAEEGAKNRSVMSKAATEQIQSLEDSITQNELQAGGKKQKSYEQEFQQRMALYDRLRDLGALTEDEYTHKVTEASKQRSEALAAETKKWQEQLDAINSAALADARLKVQQIENDDSRTALQKEDLLAALQQENDLLTANIALEKLSADSATRSDVEQIEAKRKYNELLIQQAELEKKIADEKKLGTFGGSLNDQWNKQQGNVQNTGSDAAGAIVSPFQGLQSGLDNAFATMMQKGTTLKQFFGTVSMDIAKSFEQSVAKMASDWITNQVMMAAKWVGTHVLMNTVSAAFGVKDVAITSATTAAKVGIHTAGEQSMTGSTMLGVLQRGVARVYETLVHGIQVALRVAAHLLGEAQATAATIAGAIKRIIAWAFSAGAGAASAEASIPYAGPILAIAAMGAMIGAVIGLASGLADGGLVSGPGTARSDSILTRLSNGEFVVPAHKVNEFGSGFFESIRTGSLRAQDLASLAAPNAPNIIAGVARSGDRGGGSTMVQGHKVNLHFYDERPHPKDYLNSSEGMNHVISIAQKNRRKIGIGT